MKRHNEEIPDRRYGGLRYVYSYDLPCVRIDGFHREDDKLFATGTLWHPNGISRDSSGSESHSIRRAIPDRWALALLRRLRSIRFGKDDVIYHGIF